jgi:hypothetical protein
MLFTVLLLAQAAAAPAAPAAPAPVAPACATTDAALPAPLAGWTAPADSFDIGKAVTLTVGEADKIAGVPQAKKPGGAVLIGFKVEKAGTYGIALDQPGWIDVLPGIQGTTALESSAHGHGPACSTIRKIVRYALQPGAYRLYLTGLAKPNARVMLVGE